MATANNSKSIEVFGDTLTVNWNGNVWVSPVNGQQHSSYRAALAVELDRYEEACGTAESERTSIDDYDIIDN